MSIQTSIDGLKRIALKQVVDNLGTNINSQHIISKLNDYIRYGSSVPFALSSMYSPIKGTFNIGDVSAKLLLAYLELYTQYIINAANSDTIINLSAISYSKYLYIIFKYKELNSLIAGKAKQKEYKYTQHIDFAAPSNIYGEAFTNSIFGLSNTLQLSYNNILSLPILKSKYIYPNTLYSYISDHTISDFVYNSDNKNISSTVYRKYGNSVGSVKNTNYITLTSPSASGSITFNGTINGFISSSLYFKLVSFVLDDSNNITSLTYQSSINATDWDYSNTLTDVQLNTANRIYALDSLDTSIDFYISDVSKLIANTIWELQLDYIKIDYPICTTKMVFNSISPISYIKYNDISEFDLIVQDTCDVREEEISTSIIKLPIYKNSIQGIIPVNDQIYSVDIEFQQDRHKVSSDSNGNMQLRYNYDIADIIGYSNIYYKTGSIIFSPLAVDNISTVCVDCSFETSSSYSGESISRAQILNTIVIENEYGTFEIPVLDSTYYQDNPTLVSPTVSGGQTINTYYALEPLILNQNTYYNNMETYNLKFRFGTTGTNSMLYLLNPYQEVLLSGQSIVTLDKTNTYNTRITIDVTNHINRHYVYKDVVNVGKMYDTNSTVLDGSSPYWTSTPNRCAYMFYIDYDGNTKLALKQLVGNVLIPFTGNIYGKITMLSADESYISPYVMSYTLSAI